MDWELFHESGTRGSAQQGLSVMNCDTPDLVADVDDGLGLNILAVRNRVPELLVGIYVALNFPAALLVAIALGMLGDVPAWRTIAIGSLTMWGASYCSPVYRVASLGERAAFGHHTTVAPPSTTIVWPVMYPEAAEARNTATPFNSPARPTRRMGIRASTSGPMRSRTFSVRREGKKPGAIAFTRMPWRAHFAASSRVIASIPPFEAA